MTLDAKTEAELREYFVRLEIILGHARGCTDGHEDAFVAAITRIVGKQYERGRADMLAHVSLRVSDELHNIAADAKRRKGQ